MFRSLLFVPGNRPDLIAKAVASGADALILDLEDAVPPGAKPEARRAVAAFLEARPQGPAIFVRVNPLASTWLAEDLAAILPAAPSCPPRQTGWSCPRRKAATTCAASSI